MVGFEKIALFLTPKDDVKEIDLLFTKEEETRSFEKEENDFDISLAVLILNKKEIREEIKKQFNFHAFIGVFINVTKKKIIMASLDYNYLF